METTAPDAETTPAEESIQSRRRDRIRRLSRYWFRDIALILTSLAVSGFVVTLLGPQTYRWRGFDVQVGIRPAWRGQTQLIFTPLGELHARTHRTPLALDIELRAISFDEVRKLVNKPPHRAVIEQEFEQTARKSMRGFIIWQIALGAVGALPVPLFFRLRRSRFLFLSAFCGGALVAGAFLHAKSTFNGKAFESPVYTGSLKQADWIISLAKTAFANAETLSDKVKQVAAGLNSLYGQINLTPGLAADIDTIRVLHISDIHNNHAAVNFVRELAEKTKVNLVIDTGDLSDLGLPIENELSKGIAELKVPYLFVAGNHDSQATVAAIRQNLNALILADEPVSVAGLSILGSPDPSSARPGSGDVNTSLEALKLAGYRLMAAYGRAPTPPDIVCVHNPRQAESLIGRARVILCGHLHKQSLETRDGSVICNAGTTGAAGVRFFERRDGEPLSAMILAFAKGPKPHLLFVDQIMYNISAGEYSISRRAFNRAR